jgi:hypothetical protein
MTSHIISCRKRINQGWGLLYPISIGARIIDGTYSPVYEERGPELACIRKAGSFFSQGLIEFVWWEFWALGLYGRPPLPIHPQSISVIIRGDLFWFLENIQIFNAAETEKIPQPKTVESQYSKKKFIGRFKTKYINICDIYLNQCQGGSIIEKSHW